MSPRSLTALAASGVAVVLFAMPAAAQSTASPAAAKPAPTAKTAAAVKTNNAIPRTADGHPDLSGVFTTATAVPVARPANLGAKEFYTDEADRQASTARPAAGGGGRGGAAIDPETGRPAVGVHYDNAQFALGGNAAQRSPNLQTSIIMGPEGRVPPMTAAATKRRQDAQAFTAAHQWDGPETRPLAERCITWGFEGPPMMPVGYNSNVQIVQGQGFVSVLQEMIHDARLIPTDNRPHLPAEVKQWMGDPRGHWEGDTLVVETTNFTTRTSVQQAPTSEMLKVIEKFSRVDANTVLYQFTVDDPGTWAKPWSGQYTMSKVDGPIYEYACNEGNYGMANNLSAARAQEKK
jgi:hypothetical protein